MELDLVRCSRHFLPAPDEDALACSQFKVPHPSGLSGDDAPCVRNIELQEPALENREVRDQEPPASVRIVRRERAKPVAGGKTIDVPVNSTPVMTSVTVRASS